MQQRRFQQVRRFRDAITPGHQLGAANRKKLLGAKADSVEAAPIAVAVPDRNVDLFPNEVDMMHRCGNPQIDAGMGLGKPAEPIYQPFGRKIRRCADRQNAGVLLLQDALGAGGDSVECVTYDVEIFAAGVTDNQPLALAIEKLDAERVLQRFDLMADSALGDTELLSRSREAFASRRSLERLEGVQWWQLAGHGPLSWENLRQGREMMLCCQAIPGSIHHGPCLKL